MVEPRKLKRGSKLIYTGGSKCRWLKKGQVMTFLRPRGQGTRVGVSVKMKDGKTRRTVLSAKTVREVKTR